MIRRDWLKGLAAMIGGGLAVKAIPVEAVAAPLEEAAKVLVADSCTGLPGVAEPVYPLLTAEQSKNFVEQFKACFRPIGEITNVDWGTGPSRTVKVVARIHDSVICDMIESEKVVGTSMSLEQLGLDYKELEEKLYRSQGIPPGMLDVNRHNYETDLLRRMYGDVKETRRYSSVRDAEDHALGHDSQVLLTDPLQALLRRSALELECEHGHVRVDVIVVRIILIELVP